MKLWQRWHPFQCCQVMPNNTKLWGSTMSSVWAREGKEACSSLPVRSHCLPIRAVLTAEEASEAGTVLGKPDAVARSDAEAPAPSADTVPPPSISAPLLAADAIGAAPAPSSRREGRRLLLQGGNGRRGLRQEPLLASGGEAPTPAPATLPAPVNPADFAAPEEHGLAAALFTIGGDLPTPRVDPGAHWVVVP
jgi:hypothetical protein